jgi:hypothetical protein
MSEPNEADIEKTLKALSVASQAGRLMAEAEAAKAMPETFARLQLERLKFKQWQEQEAAKAARKP